MPELDDTWMIAKSYSTTSIGRITLNFKAMSRFSMSGSRVLLMQVQLGICGSSVHSGSTERSHGVFEHACL